MTYDPDALAQDGLPLDLEKGRILLIACGALAREILTLNKANGWDHLHLHCLPANYHHYPDKIVPAVEKMVTERRDDFDDIFVVYADCGTGGLLEAACDRLGIKMIAGPHCFSFFEGNDAFEALDEMTAFYLTDFSVRQFNAFIVKPLGLDRHPALRDMYFGNYEKVVYQAQLDDPELTAQAQKCADILGLPLERRLTGYGDLATTLAALPR
ncbi:MAG: DUF1638 domain-containing protein [Sulfitobacter sp.]